MENNFKIRIVHKKHILNLENHLNIRLNLASVLKENFINRVLVYKVLDFYTNLNVGNWVRLNVWMIEVRNFKEVNRKIGDLNDPDP